jgi:UDP-3-O-[3-hydroxymyristoyl] glucosamine N-acyltransferase
LHGGNHIGAQCQLTEDVILFQTPLTGTEIGKRGGSIRGPSLERTASVCLTAGPSQVPQIGNVIIRDDVEIART